MVKIVFLSLFVALLSISSAFADIVHLNDGRALEGEIISETMDTVTLKTALGEITIKREDIERIEKELWTPPEKPSNQETPEQKEKREKENKNTGSPQEQPKPQSPPQKEQKPEPSKRESKKAKEKKEWKAKPMLSLDECKNTAGVVPWEQRRTIETTYYTIYTNLSDACGKKYGKMVDAMWVEFCKVFNYSKTPPEKPKIYICSTYKVLIEVLKKFPNVSSFAAPCYSPQDKAIFVCHMIQEGGCQSTLLHEGTHQFQDMVLNHHSIPIWLSEGLACFFGVSQFDEEGKLHIGCIPVDRDLRTVQEAIRTNQYIKLTDLIKMPHDSFYAKQTVELSYNQSWSLIYWIVMSNKNNREIFNRYWERCCKKGDSNDSCGFLEVIGVPIEKVEEHWKEWVLILNKEDKPEDVEAKSKEFDRKWQADRRGKSKPP
jgi:hypothetical protein